MDSLTFFYDLETAQEDMSLKSWMLKNALMENI